jgi:hypothetical protein
LKANYKVLSTGRGHLLAPAPRTELRGMHGSESAGLDCPGQSGRVASQERETPIRVEAKHCTIEGHEAGCLAEEKGKVEKEDDIEGKLQPQGPQV